MTIRYATIDDAYCIASINVNGWKTAYKGIVSNEELESLDIEKAKKNAREHIITKPHELVVIENVNEIEGFIGFGKSRDEDVSLSCAEIYAVYFDSKYFGNGSSQHLMDWIFNRLKEIGYEEVSIWFFKDNHRARRFYEKMGFVNGNKEKWYRNQAIEYRFHRYL